MINYNWMENPRWNLEIKTKLCLEVTVKLHRELQMAQPMRLQSSMSYG